MKYKKVLVTGSSGFIGQKLVDELLAQGHQVVGVDIAGTLFPKKMATNLLGGKWS